jgi:hypothetical protein
MSATAAPYGLRPVNLIGGQPYAGSTRLIKIASGYGANLFFGQPVRIAGDGTIVAAAVTTTAPATGITGVFVGCTYTDPNLNIPIYKQYWPTGTVASDAFAYVVDDPDVVFQLQADGAVSQSALGENIGLNASSGDTATGNATTSGNAGAASTSSPFTGTATASLPFRIVGFVESTTSTVGDAYTDLLVKINAPYNNAGTIEGGHSYNQPTGAGD